MSCIFCEIVKGNIPSYKIFEDEKILAFLDVHPIHEGHVLVIPKIHEPHLQKLDEGTYQSLMLKVKHISELVEEKIKPNRIVLKVEGWDVPHAHVHIVPMDEPHERNRSNPSPEDLAATQQKIIN